MRLPKYYITVCLFFISFAHLALQTENIVQKITQLKWRLKPKMKLPKYVMSRAQDIFFTLHLTTFSRFSSITWNFRTNESLQARTYYMPPPRSKFEVCLGCLVANFLFYAYLNGISVAQCDFGWKTFAYLISKIECLLIQVRKYQNIFSLFSITPKNQRKNWQISVLVSKKWLNKKTSVKWRAFIFFD